MKAIRLHSTFSVLLFWFSIFSSANGQDLSKMILPEKFESYLFYKTLDSIDNGKLNLEKLCALQSKSKAYWQVFIANSGSKIYSSYSTASSVVNSDLFIGTRMFVAEVKYVPGKDNWLHVFNDERKNPVHGWIRARDLILSTHAATLNEESATRKAMLLTTIDNIDPANLSEHALDSINKIFQFYTSYTGTNKSKRGNKLDIYFILKQQGQWWLLSNSDIIDKTTPPTGWIKGANLTSWDSKLCLEPHYLKLKASPYENTEVKIFTEKKYLEDYLANGKLTTSKNDAFKNVSVPPYPDEVNRRLGSNSFRYPVLNKEGSIKKVAAVASLNNSDSEESERTREGTLKEIEETKIRLKNVDILFVVDATSSMTKYMDAIQSSITRIVAKSDQYDRNFRIGLAVYRDYLDRDQAYEMIQPLTSDISRITQALGRVQCFSNDNDLPEAQYNGIIKALKGAGFTQKNNNVLVLIGDAGNHLPGPESVDWMNRKDPKGVQPSAVIQAMDSFNINPIVFQVMNGSDDAFYYFKYDAQNFIRKRGLSATTSIDAYSQLEKSDEFENTYFLTYINKTDKKAVDYSIASLLPFGSYTYASSTTIPMNPRVLEDNIFFSIEEYSRLIDEQIKAWQNLDLSSGEKFNNSVVIASMKSKGFTDKQIESISQGGDFAMRGYAADSYVPDGSVWYFPVIFLTEAELGSIRNAFESMLNRNKMTQTQKSFQDAIIELASKMLSNEPLESIENMTLNDVWEILLDVRMVENDVNNTKIGQLAELDDQVFESWYRIFSTRASKFIGKSFEESKKLNQMHTFYWIPVSEVPCYNIVTQ